MYFTCAHLEVCGTVEYARHLPCCMNATLSICCPACSIAMGEGTVYVHTTSAAIVAVSLAYVLVFSGSISQVTASASLLNTEGLTEVSSGQDSISFCFSLVLAATCFCM